jgi:hypothetical protein
MIMERGMSNNTVCSLQTEAELSIYYVSSDVAAALPFRLQHNDEEKETEHSRVENFNF